MLVAQSARTDTLCERSLQFAEKLMSRNLGLAGTPMFKAVVMGESGKHSRPCVRRSLFHKQDSSASVPVYFLLA